MAESTQRQGLQGQCIVSLALEDWHSTWRSRQHLLSRLARDNDVLYCTSPVFTHEVRERWVHRAELTPTVEEIAPRLVAYRPPYWLPQLYRAGALRKTMRGLLLGHLQLILRARGWKPTLLYIWHPSFVDWIDSLPGCALVYHCYDEYGSFEADDTARRTIWDAECRLLDQARVAFTASETLKQRRQARNPNIYVIPNGVDYDLFARAADPTLPMPADAAAIAGPLVGFVTTLTTITDLPLLHSVFSQRADWTFMFIGLELAVAPTEGSDLGRLLALPNVRIIGRRKLQEIPGYLKRCDVLAIPWLINEISLSGSPLKLYEYLASGKPVVSTPLSHLQHLNPVIAFAPDARAWIDAIEQALAGQGPGSGAARQEIARQNTWDAKADLLAGHLQAALR